MHHPATTAVPSESAVGLSTAPFLLLTAYWVWMLVDAIRTPDGAYRAGDRIIWVLVIILTGWLGAVIYQFVGRPRTA